jgi:hypothetical protein
MAATRLYKKATSYSSTLASSASVISNTVPGTRLSSFPLNLTLAWCVFPMVATTCGSSILTNDGSNLRSSSLCPLGRLPNVDSCTFSRCRVPYEKSSGMARVRDSIALGKGNEGRRGLGNYVSLVRVLGRDPATTTEAPPQDRETTERPEGCRPRRGAS